MLANVWTETRYFVGKAAAWPSEVIIPFPTLGWNDSYRLDYGISHRKQFKARLIKLKTSG